MRLHSRLPALGCPDPTFRLTALFHVEQFLFDIWNGIFLTRLERRESPDSWVVSSRWSIKREEWGKPRRSSIFRPPWRRQNAPLWRWISIRRATRPVVLGWGKISAKAFTT